jgi:Concanavalin A-like lectin/glucanases superfamily
MRNRKAIATGILVAGVMGIQCASAGEEFIACHLPDVVACYGFDAEHGDVVEDESGHDNQGTIVGGAISVKGVHGRALLLKGTNWIRVPHSPSLDFHGPATVTAWVSGRASELRLVLGNPGFRGPSFQVAGDRVYLATNNDDRPRGYDPTGRDSFEWRDTWNLWTAVTDLTLSDWTYQRRTTTPFSGLEPKVQVIDGHAVYEYFGQDHAGVWQIYVAHSDLKGSNWRTTQVTDERPRPGDKFNYAVEQADNIQVVGNEIYCGFPRKDTANVWHTMLARVAMEGADPVLREETGDRGWIPSIQVVGNSIYYMYIKPDSGRQDVAHHVYDLFMARSDLDGGNWAEFPKIAQGVWVTTGTGTFKVHQGRIYLSYPKVSDTRGGWTSLVTAQMDLDGKNRREITRTHNNGFAGTPRGGLQIVGDKLYYVFGLLPTDKSIQDLYSPEAGGLVDFGRMGLELWTAESNLDGSNWVARKRTPPPDNMGSSYRALQIVGAKLYLSTMRYNASRVLQEVMGVAGANIVSKGDAFGIGITEEGTARAFVNAGQDYLFRAEAPSDIAGGTADHPISDDTWHHVAATFDSTQVSLYIDGELASHRSYNRPPARNPFPVLIGDGFQGSIDEVVIFNKALDKRAISQLYKAGQLN